MAEVDVGKQLPLLVAAQGAIAEAIALASPVEIPEDLPLLLKWKGVLIGGGGYITNVARNRVNGLLFAGTDVQNGYFRRPGDPEWATIFRRDTMDPKDMVRSAEGNSKGDGLASCMVAFAGQDGTRAYSHIHASVFTIDLDPAIPLTKPGGIKCRRWNLPLKHMRPNLGDSKFSSPGMAGHPTDKETALLGTWNDGAYFTKDGGYNCPQIDVPVGFGSAAPEKGRERYLVWIDQTNPQICYIFCQGTGLHRSTTGVAGPYTLIEGGPKMAVNLFGEPDGTLWVCGDGRIPNETGSAYVKGLSADAGLWTLKGDAWTFIGNPLGTKSNFPWHVAVATYPSKVTGGKVVLCWAEAIGALNQRGGTGNWFYMENASTADVIAGGEAAWHLATGLRVGGGFAFTEEYGEILLGGGFGVLRDLDFLTPEKHSDYPLQAALPRILAHDYSAGIEEFIVNNIFVNPTNGRIFLNCWDRHIVEVTDLDAYTAAVRMPTGARLSIAHGMDNAIDYPDYYVCAAGSGTPAHSYSEGGKAWTQFAATAAEKLIAYPDSAGNGSAGAIAMSNRDDIVICQSNNLPAIESRGSKVFRQIRLNGLTSYSTINSYTTIRKNVSADKTRPGVFAMVVPMTVPGVQNAVNNPLGGLWVRPGINAEWEQTFKGRIGSKGETSQFWNCHLKYVPGRSGELLYTGYIGQAQSPLVHLTDDGRAQSEFPDVSDVLVFGFGRNRPGAAYPVVMFRGKYKGIEGFWMTLDWFATCEFVSDIFLNNYWSSGTTSIAGDMTESGLGKWFVSIGGKGAVYALPAS
jgi:hypothetical protein